MHGRISLLFVKTQKGILLQDLGLDSNEKWRITFKFRVRCSLLFSEDYTDNFGPPSVLNCSRQTICIKDHKIERMENCNFNCKAFKVETSALIFSGLICK